MWSLLKNQRQIDNLQGKRDRLNYQVTEKVVTGDGCSSSSKDELVVFCRLLHCALVYRQTSIQRKTNSHKRTTKVRITRSDCRKRRGTNKGWHIQLTCAPEIQKYPRKTDWGTPIAGSQTLWNFSKRAGVLFSGRAPACLHKDLGSIPSKTVKKNQTNNHYHTQNQRQ